jgi:DNA (cytosine-5)-methyltransferase 1
VFNKPPTRNPKALFRAHPIKSGNMTVDLTNRSKDAQDGWYVVAHAGTGEGYNSVEITKPYYTEAKKILASEYPLFLKIISEDSSFKQYSHEMLDKKNKEYGFISDDIEHPYNLVKKTESYIRDYLVDNKDKSINSRKTKLLVIKKFIPLSQIMSIYSLGVLLYGK